MSSTRKSYTKEFKLAAIRLIETSGKPTAQVERELGIPQGLVSRWRQRLIEQGAEAFPGKGRLPVSEERLRQLERENLILRQEREILEKAIAVLSPKSE